MRAIFAFVLTKFELLLGFVVALEVSDTLKRSLSSGLILRSRRIADFGLASVINFWVILKFIVSLLISHTFRLEKLGSLRQVIMRIDVYGFFWPHMIKLCVIKEKITSALKTGNITKIDCTVGCNCAR